MIRLFYQPRRIVEQWPGSNLRRNLLLARLEQSDEKGVRMGGARFEFGVELHADVERIRGLDGLHDAPIGGEAA